MASYTYIPVFNRFYNPIGVATPVLSSSVLYNGTNHSPSSGTATYTLSNGMTLSVIESNVWLEFGVTRVLISANTANIATNTAGIAALVTALANLKTSASQYDGTVKTSGGLPDPSYNMTTNEELNDILVAIWNEFVIVYTAIAATTTGVSLATLNATLFRFVTDFTIGLNNTSNTLLVATIASGSASIGGQRVVYAGGTINISATQDNYVYLKTDGTLTYLHVNNGAGQPSTPANSIILWKLITDGTHVTTATDKRNPYPFTVSQLADYYAANSLPFASRKISEWTDYLLPASATTGKVLQTDGSGWIEGTVITVDENNSRVGVNQTSPQVTLDIGGSAVLGNDGGTIEGEISYSAGKFYGRNATDNLILPQIVSDISDVTISAPAIGDILYNNGSGWINKPQGTTSVTSTAAVLYTILATDKKVFGDVTANTVNLMLPDATVYPGREIFLAPVGDASIHNLTISSAAGLVHGAATLVINSANKCVLAVSNGTDWYCLYGA